MSTATARSAGLSPVQPTAQPTAQHSTDSVDAVAPVELSRSTETHRIAEPATGGGAIRAALRYWWPLATTGSLATACAVIGGWQSAVMTAGWVIVGGRMSARRFARHRQLAAAQIIQSTSSPLSVRRNTYFDSLVATAQAEMKRMEAAAQQADERSAHAEARGHLARRDASRLQTALAMLPVPTVLFDNDGVVFAANAAAGEALPEARPGETLPADGPVAPLTQTIDQMRARADQAEDVVRELALPSVTRGPGESTDHQTPPPVRSYQVTVRPMRSGGRVVGAVATLLETTDRDEIKQQCAQFLGAACHELKTPMASIRAHVELLADGDLETAEEQAESLGFIDEQADRLARLVDNMLNLSRVQSGLVKVNRENVSLEDVLAKPLELLQTAAAKKSITLVDELSDLHMPVYVDVDLFGQAVTNLLSNAVKYTPNAGTVRLRSRLDERHAIIDVQDSGLGIPADSLPRIFDRFYRVPENNYSAPGTGLGLSLVQFIAEDIHGGAISVESEVGQGSTFSIRLPLGHFGSRRRSPEPAATA